MATADALIAGLKNRGIVPSSQVLFDDSDFLTFADRVISGQMVPLMISVRQDYFVTKVNQTLTSGTSEYAIPARAIGRAIRDLKLVQSSQTVYDLYKIDLEDEHYYYNTASPACFYMNQDYIVLRPTPSNSTDILQIWYEIAPSSLVKLDECGVVQTIASNSLTLTTTPPAELATGVYVDVIRHRPGHSITHMDLLITGITGNQLNFATDSITTALVTAGDYVSVAGTTPVIQLPEECYSLIETLTAARFLQSNGDNDAARMLEDKAKEEMIQLKLILEPRSRGEPTVIVNRNGLLRGDKGRYRRGFFS